MRHHRAHRKLGREKGQRVALIRSLARSLVLHGAITTTVAKAKELRPFVERLITSAKSDTLASRRSIIERLGNQGATTKRLISEIAPRYTDRTGGYTRITKLGRVGKRVAEFARIELLN